MSDKLLSVILLLNANEAQDLKIYLDKTTAVLPKDCEQFQIIVVQDGGEPVLKIALEDLLNHSQGLRYICLAQASGLAKALSAGLEAAIGDLCVTVVPSRDPINLIPHFIESCERHSGIVVGQRINPGREGNLFFQIGKRGFHFLTSLLGSKFPKNTTFMTCLDRNALTVINQAGDRDRYLRAITSNVGLNITIIPYQLEGELPLRSFWAALNLSLDILFMNTVQPLRLATLLAVSLSAANFIYLLYLLGNFAAKLGEFPVTETQIALGSTFLFTILAIFSEYIQRLLLELRDRPNYIVARDMSTTEKVHNFDRPNLTKSANS